MILRDVDLLCDASLRERRPFQFSVNCVVSLYRRLLGEVHTRKHEKAVVRLVPLGAGEGTQVELLNVVLIEKAFDFDGYWRLQELAQKQAALEALHTGLMQIAKTLAWESGPFGRARHEALAMNLDTSFFWDHECARDGKLARLFCEFGQRLIDVSLVIGNDCGESDVTRTIVLSLEPAESFLYLALGSFKWDREDRISLTSRDGSVVWRMLLLSDRKVIVSRIGERLPGEILRAGD